MNSRLNLVFSAVLFMAVVGLYFLHFFKNEQKIAYVDSAKLLGEYHGMVEARKAYEQKAMGWQANVDTLLNEVQDEIKKHERESGSMTARERSMSEQLIRNKQAQLANYQEAIREQARQEDAKLTQGVLSQVNTFLERYGKKHDYKLILIASPGGSIAYAKEGLDLTEEVVRELNQEYGLPQE